MDNFDTICGVYVPLEIWYIISDHLRPIDIIHLRYSAKYFDKIFNPQTLNANFVTLKHPVEIVNPLYVEKASKFGFNIKYSNEIIYKFVDYSLINILCILERFTEEERTVDCNLFYNLEELSIHTDISLTNAHKMQNLKRLNIVGAEDYWGPYLDIDLKSIPMKNITHLKIVSSTSRDKLGRYKKLKVVELRNTDIVSLHIFKHVKEIILEECHDLTDVSPINQIKKVSIKNCSKVNNYHMLNEVEDLTIEFDFHAHQNIDIGDYKKCTKLNIKYANIKYSHHNKNLTSLDISYSEVSGNRLILSDNITELFLDNVKFEYISDLNKISRLSIEQCSNWSDYDSLTNNKILSIIDHPMTKCPKLKDTIYLNFSYCSKLTDLSNLSNIYEINISDCRSLVDISPLRTAKIIHMGGCINVTDVSALKDADYIDMYLCTGITDVSALVNVKVIKIARCCNIKDISMLRGKIIL